MTIKHDILRRGAPNEVRVAVKAVPSLAAHLGPAWRKRLMAAARREGDHLVLSRRQYSALWFEHHPRRRKNRSMAKPIRYYLLWPVAWWLRRFDVREPGVVIERIAKPVARALRMPCHDRATGRLKPGSRSARARDALNAAGRREGGSGQSLFPHGG